MITVSFVGGTKRHSSDTCRATVWITASVTRDDTNETNKLDINFVEKIEENVSLKFKLKFFLAV